MTYVRPSSDKPVKSGASHSSGERRGVLLWAGFWLALVLIGSKAVMLGDADSWKWILATIPAGAAVSLGGDADSWKWMMTLIRISYRDVLFAFALGGVGELCVLALAGKPRTAVLVRRSVLITATVCAFFSVVACGVFKALGRPLSFDLLRLIRGAAVKSSIADRLTWQIVLSMIAVPAGFFLLAQRNPRLRIFSQAVLPSMGLWILAGSLTKQADEGDLKSRRLALCPHVELVRSTVVGILGRSHPNLESDYPPEDMEECRSFAERTSLPRTAFQPPAGVGRPKNVIVIVLESVGTKYLSLYGSRYDTTPHLLKESRHALVFDNISAHAPYTFCSFMALNFSMYPGVPWAYAPGAFYPENQPGYLPPTFASVMKQRGSRTAYLHNGDLEWGGTNEILKGEGYDSVEDFRTLKAPPLTSWGAEDRYLFDRLIQFIDEKPGQPFLAYCWTDQTHHPYAQRPEVPRVDFFKGKPPKQLADELSNYLNVIRETDGHLGRLFDALRERGIADDTLVVITGDHGEAFRDPHYQQQHGYSVWQEEVNVPFMVWNPRLFPEGRHMPEVGGHVDLNPTVADILGVEPPDAWQGHSLFVPSRPNRTFFVASVDDYLLGIREDRWKYILEMTGGRESLFDLAADPEEKHNLLSTDPSRVKRMRQRLSAWIAFEDHYLSTPPPRRVPVALRQNTVEK